MHRQNRTKNSIEGFSSWKSCNHNWAQVMEKFTLPNGCNVHWVPPFAPIGNPKVSRAGSCGNKNYAWCGIREKKDFSNDFPSLYFTSFVCICSSLDTFFLAVISQTNIWNQLKVFGTCCKRSARLGVDGTTFILNDSSFKRKLTSFAAVIQSERHTATLLPWRNICYISWSSTITEQQCG